MTGSTKRLNDQIEPELIVLEDDEPTRKRARGSSEEGTLLERLIAEAVEKALKSATSQFEEKLLVYMKNMFQLELQIEKLQKDSLQKEIKNRELQEKLAKIEQTQSEKIHVLQHKTANLEVCYSSCKSGIVELQKRQAQAHQSRPATVVSSDNCNIPPTPAELEFQFKCVFCNSKRHTSTDCRGTPYAKGRKSALGKHNRCTMCLETLEDHMCPRAHVMCSNCQWDTRMARKSEDFHHPYVCPLNDQSGDVMTRRELENERRRRHGLPPRFII